MGFMPNQLDIVFYKEVQFLLRSRNIKTQYMLSSNAPEPKGIVILRINRLLPV